MVSASGPGPASTLYNESFSVSGKLIIKAVAMDEASGLKIEVLKTVNDEKRVGIVRLEL